MNSVIHRDSHYFKRKVIEASYIKLTDRPISHASLEIRPRWLPIIKNELKCKENKTPIQIQNKTTQKTHTMTLSTQMKRP